MTLEEQRHAMLEELETPAARKDLVMEWYCYGLIGAEHVGFWFYVWDLFDA